LIAKLPAAIPNRRKKVKIVSLEKRSIWEDVVIYYIFDLNVLNFDVAI